VAWRRASAQVPDPVNGRLIQTGEVARLDIKPPAQNPLQQLRALQTQLFGQLVHSRRQRQLLQNRVPVFRVRHNPGLCSRVQLNLSPPRPLVTFLFDCIPARVVPPAPPSLRAFPLVCSAGLAIASRTAAVLKILPNVDRTAGPRNSADPEPQRATSSQCQDLSPDRPPALSAARSAREVGVDAPEPRLGAVCSTASVTMRIPSP
jgi:hypothetical protein